MVEIIFFTIISRNYAAQARVLLKSLATFHPTHRFLIIAADGDLDESEFGVAIVNANNICGDVKLMSLYYDAVEYNTALKPFAFRYIFQQFEPDAVVYLDPDIELFAPLEPVIDALSEVDIVVTPHLATPLSDDAVPNDLTILRSGAYNLGFLALRRAKESASFLDWWADKCQFECRVDFAAGLFTDQRWIDLAPSLFAKSAILRDPGVNLAYWNLPARCLERVDGQWKVDGRPLRFFHFSGFSPWRPQVLSKYQNRLWPNKDDPLAVLLAEYAAALLAAGYQAASSIPYGFERLDDGRRLTGLMRRTVLTEARRGGDFTDPFSARTSTWLDAPDPRASPSLSPRPSRIMNQFLSELEAGAGYQPWTSTEEAFALFFRHGAGQGADSASLTAARALWDSEGPSSLLSSANSNFVFRADMPDPCQQLWLARADLQIAFPIDQLGVSEERVDEFIAHCLGVEALRGKFDPKQLEAWLSGLTSARLQLLARQAVNDDGAPRLGRPLGAQARASLHIDAMAAFGLGPRAGWPDSALARLRAPWLERLGQERLPLTPPAFALQIWRDRPDLQSAFDLDKITGRLGFLRWLLRSGANEYGLHTPTLRQLLPFWESLIV